MIEILDWQKPPDKFENLFKGEVHVWRAQLLVSDQQLDAAKQLLNKEELSRGQRFVKPELRRRSWMAHAWKRSILARYLSKPESELFFINGSYGKPYLQWGKDHSHPILHFNMSHSEEWALFAVTLDSEIGVDIEKIEMRIDPLELAKRFFSEREYDNLKKLPLSELMPGFYRIWALKEAVIKALGKGLSHSLSSFEVYAAENFVHCLKYIEQYNANLWTVFAFPAVKGFASALALPQQIKLCCFWDVSTETCSRKDLQK